LPAAVNADYVRDAEWANGGDGTLDLTNAGDGVVIVHSVDEGTAHADVTQGTVAIDTVAPESMTAGPVETGSGAGVVHLETFYRNTAKTGSTTIDENYSTEWITTATLIEGYDGTSLSDSCKVDVNPATTNWGCSVTVPDNGIVIVSVATETSHTVSSWKESATNRNFFSASAGGDSLFLRVGTKVETTGQTATYGVDFADTERGVLIVLVFAAAGSTTTWTDTTIDVGQDAAGTLDVAFSGNTTQCEFASGDTISVTANASTTAGDCATAKADFLSGGSLSNTRIASATTAFLRNVTETSTAGSITINSPDDGVNEHFGTAACANPGCDDDSLYENSDFLTEYAAFASGDDVWVTVNTGACDFDATTGVFSCTTLPASGVVRVYDVTATDWLTESTWSIEAPVTSGSYRLRIASPLRDAIRSPLRAPIQ
jgi:hypothetical protein